MTTEPGLTDEHLLKMIGERIAALRLAQNLTQQQLAEQTGLGLRTVQRLELGAETQLSGFVRVCRVLGLLERFDALIPEPAISPIAQLKLKGKQRQRATGSKAGNRADPQAAGSKTASKTWSWSDDSNST